MGVPAFFRWLSRKYPSVIIECVENKTVDSETGRSEYEDAALPNPNGIEFDNLYLDMNGIIHPCTHPEDKPPPKNEEEMMVAIFECIDRLFAIVRPRKLLYMAIDGVAPRAKMNQQRSRRFRAAKESTEKRLEIERIRDELQVKGFILPPPKAATEHFDSNCITPGTPFMDRLSQCLHYYIHDRMNNNPAWKTIKVILSDANVPGEGEHKIMDFIRKQRAQPDHDPNTQHVLCGADADLIMLGLATHEPNFTIIREEFLPNKPRPCDICGQIGHEMDKCVGLPASSGGLDSAIEESQISAEVKFIFVRLSVLREYLRRTLEMPNLPFKYEFERVLDDWVFMCFFVGNDFLPHLPSLEIREGAIDRLIELYKKCVYKTGGFLTNSGEVNLERVQLILTDLGSMEDRIFKERQRREVQFRQREKNKKREAERGFNRLQNHPLLQPVKLGKDETESNQKGFNYRQDAAAVRMNTADDNSNRRGVKRTATEAELDEEDEDANDEVRLWEDGFKERYYESKFDVNTDNSGFRYSVALQYVRGLCWVLKYYYQGCSSWNWYFPYHYAPFASDFVNICGLSTAFEKDTEPFHPLEQLMSVFPAASRSHVPEPWADLMTNPDSPIIDFYPEDFKIDLNGKKFAWQGVALLPFVDEQRLFLALKSYYNKLTPEEVRRNEEGDCRLYVTVANPHHKLLSLQYSKKKSIEVPILIEGISGSILRAKQNVNLNSILRSPLSLLSDISNDCVTTVYFKNPSYGVNFIFPAIRLPNAIDPPKVLAPESDQRPFNYKPRIGFAQNLPQAYVDPSGHRHLNAAFSRNVQNYSGNNYGSEGQRRHQGDNFGNQGPAKFRSNFNNNYNNNGNNNNRQQHQQYSGPNSNYNRGNNGNNRYNNMPHNNNNRNNNQHFQRRNYDNKRF